MPASSRPSAVRAWRTSHRGVHASRGEDVAAVGDIGFQRGDVVCLSSRRGEQRLFAGVELDVLGDVVSDRSFERGAGA